MTLQGLTALAAGLLATVTAGTAVADPHADANAADHRGDYPAELAILKPHADMGEAWAENNLGRLYKTGQGVAKDEAQAVVWFRKAAEQGDKGGEANLGMAYENGEGVARDEALGEVWVRKAIDQGDARAAMALMAKAIPGPDDTPATIAARAARYRKAGDAGDKLARQSLQLFCVWPGPVAKPADCGQVVVWTRAAAVQGDVEAEKQLATFHDGGQMGLARDPALATPWWRKAAEAGDAGAQENLATRYELGLGVAPDKAQAMTWTRKAAEQGETVAEMSMARAFETGDGVARDDAQAFYWNRKLAAEPLSDYQNKVGEAYALGKGVPRDYLRAYIWLSIALASERPSRDEARDTEGLALESVASHLTAPQLAEGKRRALAWTARARERISKPGQVGDDEP